MPDISVQYDTEYFTFDTVNTILFSIPILNKSEASIQDKHVDKYTHTYTQINCGSRTRTCLRTCLIEAI